LRPDIWQKVQDTAEWLQSRIRNREPRIGLVLGSGLGALADRLSDPVVIPTSEIPLWPVSTVSGHRGRIVSGGLDGVPVLVQQGRVHYYEGYGMDEVVFAVRVFAGLGIRSLIITNASGALNPDFSPGDLMLITDHLNAMGVNPLVGPNDDRFGPRFPDMSAPYDPEYLRIAGAAAEAEKIRVRNGVLVAVTGPSYETAAEVRMLRLLGGDAVCMSTVPEVIAAVHLGLRVLGVSCITNLSTGLSDTRLHHAEVEEGARRVAEDFHRLIRRVVKAIHPGRPG